MRSENTNVIARTWYEASNGIGARHTVQCGLPHTIGICIANTTQIILNRANETVFSYDEGLAIQNEAGLVRF